MFSRLTMNLVGAKLRHETLEGRQYLVVPTVMMTEGVHTGSQGPLYYPKDEIGKNPLTWNHKPIVLSHPTMNGEGISACDPSVVESRRVGLLFNTTFDGRLKTESWLDHEKLKRVDNRILESLQNGQMVEVSTGLYHDPQVSPGTWNGESYTAIVRNIQPDHLAILPDEKGACSIADGAGLLRNSSGELSYDDIREMIKTQVKALQGYDYCYVCDVFPKYAIFEKADKYFKIGYKLRNGKVTLDGEPEEVRRQTSYVTASEVVLNDDQMQPVKTISAPTESQLSDVMKRQQLQAALEKKYAGGDQMSPWGGWVTDLYGEYVVWSKDGKLFRLPYTYSDDKIVFDGSEPQEVLRGPYTPKPATPASSPYSMNQEPAMATPTPTTIPNAPVKPAVVNAISTVGGLGGDGQTRTTDGDARTQMINKMVARAGESERAYFESLSDELLGKIAKYVLQGADQAIVPYSYAGIGDRSAVGATQNRANQMQTTQDYIAAAPPEVRTLLTNALAVQQAEMKRLVNVITSNVNNNFTEAWLMQQELPMLRGLAQLAGGRNSQPLHNYSGQADVPMFNTEPVQPVVNASADEVLPIPSMGIKVK